MTRVRGFLALAAFIGLLALGTLLRSPAARGEGKGDSEAQQTRLLEEIRANPERLARLRQNWETFRTLSPERQENLRQLDRELHQKGSARSARLSRTLERYNVWLEHLPPQKRKRIEQAASADDRLRLIREFREEEWLPARVREELRKRPGERAAEVRRRRQEERRRRDNWLIAFRNWDELMQDKPAVHLTSLSPRLKQFVENYLEPFASKEELERLQKAENHWPEFPRTLVELMDRHPFFLPGPVVGPTKFEELPDDVRKALDAFDVKLKDQLRPAEGSWPSYAIMVTETARAHKLSLPRQLGPCRVRPVRDPAHHQDEYLPGNINVVVRRDMINPKTGRLAEPERKRLLDAEGNWPEFPRTLVLLAPKYNVRLPPVGAVVHLPGPVQYWNRYRLRTPPMLDDPVQIPVQTLIDFGFDLPPKQRAAQRIGFGDPLGREHLRQEYIRRLLGGPDKSRRGPME
jgi:hypothetical protein